MAIIDSLLGEMEQEAGTTRRVLERVPVGKASWQPHAKSMTLEQLALHVATIPGDLASWGAKDTFDLADFKPPQRKVAAAADLLRVYDESLDQARKILRGFDDSRLMATWKLFRGGKELFSGPRVVLVRAFVLNHWYHHRGQLSVYLRLLDVPVPSIYGPSADENPFA
jgi:uncharacterized damage-inducible protein DinB